MAERSLIMPLSCPIRAAENARMSTPVAHHSGSLATTLISNWKPYSQVTPTAVTLG